MMTLRELKARTGNKGSHGRMMTEKELKIAGEKIIASFRPDPESRLSVYGNGTVVFRSGTRKAVFSVHDCVRSSWDFVTEESAVLEGEEYEEVSWKVCLYMEGMDRIENNLERADARVSAGLPDDEEVVQELPFLEDGYSLIELESCLESARKDLSPMQEMIFRSHILGNKKQAEIAREAGVSQGKISKELDRTRKILSRKLMLA